MPYIEGAQRRGELRPQSDKPAIYAGELNYQITRLMLDFVHMRGLSYATINDVMGAVEGAKLEFYRRVAAPYEDTKIEQNGDVYP